MPWYEYECSSCGSRLECRQRFGEAPLRVCPACEGALSRLIQPTGIIFKGSGWYSTDHRPAVKSEESPSPAKETSKSEKAKKAAPAA